MALVPKKTYSRRENGLLDISEREKENVDPFDVLLASPLKQDVQFQPLGFWGRKVKHLESERKKAKCGLYEPSDYDGPNSSWKESKARTLQPKSKIAKLSERRKNHSTAYSFIKRGKQQVSPSKSGTLDSTKEIMNQKGCSPKNKKEVLNLSCKSCGSFKHLNTPFRSENSIISDERACQTFHPVKSKTNNQKTNVNNLEFKINKDSSSAKQLKDINENIIHKSNGNLINKTNHFNENTEETLVLFSEGCDRFKFVTIKRHFNFPRCMTCSGSFDSSPISVSSKTSSTSPVQLWNEQKEIITPVALRLSEDDIEAEFSDYISDSVNDSLNYYTSTNETLYLGDVSHVGSEKSVTMQESLSVSLLNDSDFIYFSNTESEDTEDLLEQESVDTVAETSTTSDETISEQETVIEISPEPLKRTTLFADTQAKNEVGHFGSFPNGVSFLKTGVSDSNASKADENEELKNPGTEKLISFQSSDYEDKEGSPFAIELKHVMTKRGGFLKDKSEIGGISRPYERRTSQLTARVRGRQSRTSTNESQEDLEYDQSLEFSDIMGRMSLDFNRTVSLGNPVFESTRVFDVDPPDGDLSERKANQLEKTDCTLEEIHDSLNYTCALKPGKQWVRSMSVLKQIQNGNLTGGVFESTRITGRKFQSFVQDLLKMQNERSSFFTTVADVSVVNKTCTRDQGKNKFLGGLSSYETPSKCKSLRENDSEEIDGSLLSKTISHKTVLGVKPLLNHTVKVIKPEDSSSGFRSALKLDNRSLFEGSISDKDSIRQESSQITARDFLLIQCGQDDILPFEEYFNEKTLPNCKKIGEGVYGEVFMCSDKVIKIIPIEGSEQVNGAPQKTFEEIISEVVIASKLSGLRKGERNRTDGFSEMKRCWCVKGKYPDYLVKLWKDYDESGGGSENESPTMFKDSQLYIILELANGGKDLESFVFSSSLQALSAFIQTAFSLAVAEKAFEFEHRDLHWGNVLLSKTNDKFTSVVLDGAEYKIPTKGIKICIIDFTLSRIKHEGCCIFNDLTSDPELFTAHGDYQFEIYRMMLRELKNDWSLFSPKTNLFWLHYTVDKMIKMVRYKIRNSKIHGKHMKDLKTLESVILEYKSSASFVQSKSLTDMLIKL